MHYLGLDAVDLALLLFDLLLQVSKLIVQRRDDFLRDSLLLLQFRLAVHALFLPVLVLLVHRVDVVRYKVDALPQGVGALAQDLNGFLHELNVVLGETTACSALLRSPETLSASYFLGKSLLLLLRVLRFLAELPDYLDTAPSCSFLGLGLLLVVFLEHFLGLLDEGAVSAVGVHLELLSRGGNWLLFDFLFLFTRIIFSDDISLLGWLFLSLFALHFLRLHLFLLGHFGFLSLPVFFLLLLLLPHGVLLLLLLHLPLFIFLLSALLLLLSLRLLSLPLCFNLGLLFLLFVVPTVVAAHDLLNIRGRVYSSSRCLEKSLQEVVSLVWLQSSHDL